MTSITHRMPAEGSLHKTWNRRQPPVLTIRPGDTLTLTAPDAANGEVTPATTSEDISKIDYRRLDPLVGPVYVEGARPGDALRIEVLELRPLGWGWTALLPEFGLLWREIRDPFIRIWELDKPYVEMPSGARFDLHPMIGCIGVAPAQDGDYASITPTNAAGNIDIRYLNAGSTLLVPVFNEGALLSAADGHALQGEGEICGTAIECPMEMTLRVDVVRDAGIDAPELIVSDTFPATEGYRIFTGIGPDLMEAARDATRRAIPALAKSQGVSELEAYALLGVVGELRIHEIVDEPHWIVGCMLPRRLF
ncbi:MAG: acetamidase/formamidase family protein [Streptosporangiaceae bacterium]